MVNEIKPIGSTERQLQNIYGHKGFDVKSLYRHMQFATLFPDSQYMTELPPRDVLVQQIQKSLEVAKAKWGNERKEDEA
ncbi:DUF1016 N-terminal domain-containing protein [Segatella bryantii]|uniref:hypothetical protein n=1 Tax=Segatella bryantii TaxID=77095 RepID=UPI00087EB3BD|nr:hypothetical protein [Segatella bryantii]SDL73796.1 hypothetical protein SAMN04487899_105169 [Segatella bryantii]